MLFKTNSEFYTPDFTQANADLDELVRLSGLCGFNLFEFLRLFSEAGAPTFCCEVYNEPTEGASGGVVRYKLSEGLHAVLTAFRTRNLDQGDIEMGFGTRSACATGDGASSGHAVISR